MTCYPIPNRGNRNEKSDEWKSAGGSTTWFLTGVSEGVPGGHRSTVCPAARRSVSSRSARWNLAGVFPAT